MADASSLLKFDFHPIVDQRLVQDLRHDVARVSEGHYGGFFGWPNFTAEPTGGFMGMPATGKSGPFRVIDIYRRADDKLAENWVFIDLLHFWKSQGVDILDRCIRLAGRDLT